MSTPQPQAASGEALDSGLQLVVPGRSLPAGAGMDWISFGWKLFARSPLMWIVSLVIMFVIAIVLAFIPFLGSLAFQLLQSVFAGGFIAACRTMERGGEFELEHLFSGFKVRFVPLLIVGIVFVIASFVLILLFFLIAGVSLLPAFMSGDPDVMQAALAGSVITMLLASLVMMALFVGQVVSILLVCVLLACLDFGPGGVDAWIGRHVLAEQAGPLPARPPRPGARVGRPPLFNLTAREQEVLALLAEGMTNAQLAEALFISERTANRHLSNIFTKLGVHNRTQAARVAVAAGLAG